MAGMHISHVGQASLLTNTSSITLRETYFLEVATTVVYMLLMRPPTFLLLLLRSKSSVVFVCLLHCGTLALVTQHHQLFAMFFTVMSYRQSLVIKLLPSVMPDSKAKFISYLALITKGISAFMFHLIVCISHEMLSLMSMFFPFLLSPHLTQVPHRRCTHPLYCMINM